MAGTIANRGANSWRLTYDVGRDEAGRRIRRTLTVRGSYKDAERRLTELVSQRDQGIDVEPNKLTLEQFLTHFLRSHKVEPQSRARYQQLIRRHILPSLGATRLAAIKPLHVQDVLSVAEANVSASTAHDVFTLLKMAFAQGVRWQLIARNPADAVERPRAETKDTMRVLSPGEIEQLLSAGESEALGPLVAFALATGVRRGEALALTWANLDLDNGTATIAENARYQSGVGVVYGAPKTKKSRRVIALSSETVAALRTHRVWQSERRLRWGMAWANDRGLVFTNEVGEPFPLGSFNRQFARLVAKAGIVGRVRFHDLRHTHGTLLSQVASPRVVSDRLGHSDVKFTLNRYVNPTRDHHREAAEAFSALLKQAR